MQPGSERKKNETREGKKRLRFMLKNIFDFRGEVKGRERW